MNTNLCKKDNSVQLSEGTEFEEWLTKDVIDLLISQYAVHDPEFGILKWEYTKLPGRLWGQFHASGPILYVNEKKTQGLFKQQVSTILHEIQHWNQFVDFGTSPRYSANYGLGSIEDASESDLIRWKKNDRKVRIMAFNRAYDDELKRKGYHNNSFEMGARDFESENIDVAMKLIGDHYGQKVAGGSLDDVIEELMQDYVDNDEKPLTRFQIGTALKTYDLNTPLNLSKVVQILTDPALGIKVQNLR